MLAAHDRDLALLTALRAEREDNDARERAERLEEARRWEEYLFTALDQLTARLRRPRASGRERQPADPFRREIA
jgi:hypothetical protein